MTPRIKQSGITLVEVLVGISIVTVSLVAIGFSITSYVEARAALLIDTKAMYLAEEGYETLRAIRDTDWDTLDVLAVNTSHYLDISTTTIAVSATPEIIDLDFERWFIVREVYRNATDDIVSSTTPGATVDNGARDVTIYVESPSGTSSLRAILTNIHAI